MNDKKTIWQKLTSVLNSDVNPMGYNFDEEKSLISDTPFNSELLVAKSQQELDLKKLEAQQGKYLQDQYRHISNDRYQKSVYYETNRYSSYMDFEAMEYSPEISAALDIMSEESTCLSDNGKMLEIRSDSDRIKKILENLFLNVLDINANLPAWTRNTVKYGDNFVYLKSDGAKGIQKAVQLKNIEIKRIEGNGITGDDSVNFEWKEGGLEFNTWQVAHFRLIGDDKKLPYGTSVLEKARKIWKMMCLAEDAMMVYRLSRAPERRVFKIDVGNIDPADVETYVQKVASRFKRTSQVNQTNGQIDLRYNTLTQDEDYFIPIHNNNNGTVIDTLPGASNLSEIGDLEFLQNKLFAALRVPKTFLGFAEAAGDGKNLAMQDVRFARTVNRIQQSMLQELNKIAIIHLYLLGFREDLNNFTLSLANPSQQSDMLKQDLWGAKLDNYKKAVEDAGNGFGAWSMSKAKKEILGMSEAEIILDLQQQRLEKAEAIRNSPEVLQTKNLNSGIFNNLDTKFTDKSEAQASGATQDGAPEIGGAGGGGGGAGFDSFGGDPMGGDIGGDIGGNPMAGGDMGIPSMGGDGGMEEPELNESNMFLSKSKLLGESIEKNLSQVAKLIKE